MKHIISKYSLWIAGGAAVLVLGAVSLYISGSHAPSFTTVRALQGTVVQSVDISGRVLSETSAELSFSIPGQIARVYVAEGNMVKTGDSLVGIDAASADAGVTQAEAVLAAAQARLDSLQAGTRSEQLQIDKNAVANAQASQSAAVQSAYTSADDAVRNQTDNLFLSAGTANPQFIIPISDSQTAINIQNSRSAVGGVLDRWYAALRGSAVPDSSLAADALRQVKSYLDAVALVVNGATPTSAVPASTLAGYKTNVSAARTEVVSAINILNAAESVSVNAQSALVLAASGATVQDVEAGKAAVLGAQAAFANAQVAAGHATLRAPFPGVIQNLTAKIGQVVAPGSPMLSLISAGGVKVESFISESDIAKIKEGDAANITLDAYGTGTAFPAKVTVIDTAETSVNGTPAYKVTLEFVHPDPRIRDGMSANAHVIGESRENAIEIPTRLVISDAAGKFILVKSGNTIEKRKVETGIAGDDGMTEIVSGVALGEAVVHF